MADRDATEPLLRDPDRESASPPSPGRTSYVGFSLERSQSGGSDGPVGGISAAIRRIERMGVTTAALPGAVELRRMTVSVFYWSLYDTGKSYVYVVELQASHTVGDLIQSSLAYFAPKASLIESKPECYLLRAADKKSLPKTHFPAFGLNQAVIETRLFRFALCYKKLDDEAKKKLLDDEDLTLHPEPVPVPKSEQAKRPQRRFFCCHVS